jgi:hypothetical protein
VPSTVSDDEIESRTLADVDPEAGEAREVLVDFFAADMQPDATAIMHR